MFAPRIVAILAFCATASLALPASSDKPTTFPRPLTILTNDEIDDTPWFSFPLFGNLFAPLWKMFPSFDGPKILADDDKFQIVINVNDYKKDDLKVKLKNDFIFIQGSHSAKPDERDVFASQFFHTYTLPRNATASAVKAELTSDGYLIVTAPMDGPDDNDKDVDREVPITETKVSYQKDAKPDQPAEVTEKTDEDKKEPTTPSSEREETTEKDNSIPYEPLDP